MDPNNLLTTKFFGSQQFHVTPFFKSMIFTFFQIEPCSRGSKSNFRLYSDRPLPSLYFYTLLDLGRPNTRFDLRPGSGYFRVQPSRVRVQTRVQDNSNKTYKRQYKGQKSIQNMAYFAKNVIDI